jgi:pyruvate/2-oxoglutarate dehydrogenase complex dihydrolipoamide acyltransferase (E2) component
MRPVEVTLEQDSANDEDAVVVAIHERSGALIAEGTPIIDVETSKAVQELTAPAGGVVTHALEVGDRVEFGTILFKIAAAANEDEQAPVRKRPPATAPEATASPAVAITRRAAALMRQEGLDASDIGGRFITVEHVQRRLTEAPVRPAPQPTAAPQPAAPAGAEPLSARKRREIQTLSRGAGATMLSVIGAPVGPVRRAGVANPFFADRIVDIVAYEAARLMRAYPRLNAAWTAGDTFRAHASINPGVAFDDGQSGLVLYGIADADTLELTAIQDRIALGLERYVLGELTSGEMAGATFSITDLSPFDVDYLLPLLPANQSAIIGVTGDGAGGYRLYIGFDHRLTEGREAAHFLGDLVARVKSFDAAPANGAQELACAFCGKAMDEETGLFQSKGLLRMIDRAGHEALCCHACFSGY